MRINELVKKVIPLFFAVMALFIAVPITTEAKAANNKLRLGQTYTQFDITNDKKADTLLISAEQYKEYDAEYDMFWGYEVYINGQKALTVENGNAFYSLDIRRLELKNGMTFLAIIPHSENDDVPGAGIFQYKSGNLKKVIDLDAMSKIGYHNSIGGIKVTGNKITVKYRVMTFSLGGISFRLDYQYKNGKIVQKTTKTKITDTILKYQKKTYWTANRSMKVLKSPGGKKVTTLAKGKQVKIDKIYINSKHNKIYLHVKIKGGNSGWVKGLTKYPKSAPLFKEVMYAG